MKHIDLNDPAQQDSSLVSILSGTNANIACSIAARTRRSVRSNLATMNEQKKTQRRNTTWVIAAVVAVLLVITPTIWNAFDEFLGEERLGDINSQLTLWATIMIPAAIAALFAGWKNGRLIHAKKRNL